VEFARPGVGRPVNRSGTSALLEQSIDANNNLTEMNLVNDTSAMTQMASQINLGHDFSQVTLTQANQDLTRSQILLDEDASLNI